VTIVASKGVGISKVGNKIFELAGNVKNIQESVEILPSGRTQLTVKVRNETEAEEIVYRRISRENLADAESFLKKDHSSKGDNGDSINSTATPEIESELFVTYPKTSKYFRKHLYSTPFQWLVRKITRRQSPHTHFNKDDNSYALR